LFLIVELAAVPIKLSNDRWHTENSFIQIQKVNTPLMRVRIVQLSICPLMCRCFSGVDLKLLKVCVGTEKLLMIRDAVVLDPVVRTDKTIRETTDMSLPITDKKIEIVRSVMRGRR